MHDVVNKNEDLSPYDRKYVSLIEDFVLKLRMEPYKKALETFVYPKNALYLRDVWVETDPVNRPVLRALLAEPALGSVVVYYRDDLYARGTGSALLESERNHACLIKSMVDRLVPVISLRQTRDMPGDSLDSQIESDPTQVYFTIADNYADNRHKLESHYRKILAKQPLDPVA